MSTSSRDNRVISSLSPKPRRSPPGDVQSTSALFTGQGGRTVLPPLSSAFPTSRFPVPATYNTPYTQPRSSPGRYEYNTQVFYNPWPSSNASPQIPPTYPNYETNERYSTLPNYTTTAYPSRTSSPVGASPESPGESLRLPPLPGTNDRWSQNACAATTSSNYANMRTPLPYAPTYPFTGYSYSIPGQDYVSQAQPQLSSPVPNARTATYTELETQRPDPSPASPCNGSTNTVPSPNLPSSTSQSPTNEEPAIKKKRKRADANQLKILNDTYNRTAFPSTEERMQLAKILDMSPRSVQIWFQNKRQSMRQTSRQSSSVNSNQQTIVPPDYGMDDLGPSPSAYSSGSVALTPTPTYIPQERTQNPHNSSPPYRIPYSNRG